MTPTFVRTLLLNEKAVQQAPADGLRFLIFNDPNVPASFPKDVPAYSDIRVETFPWMTEIRDRLVSSMEWRGRYTRILGEDFSALSLTCGLRPLREVRIS
jgi:hypothetical protein